ncbi:MAG: hypothetical protein P1U61_04925 [Legionellaceae bacterium]|nr:hypothetical protein [Legionellaceae bacterium]
MIKNKLTLSLCAIGGVVLLGQAYAVPGGNDRNPASIAYVNTAIGLALETVTYRAGTGIRIDQPGNFIVATGVTESYRGVGAINIAIEAVSARFTGANGVFVPVDADGDNTGTIQGPLAGTGLNLTTSASGPGTLNLDTVYAAGQGITFTPNGSTTTISTDAAPPTLTIGQLYQGGVIFYLDSTGIHGLAVATADQSSDEVIYSSNSEENGVGSGIGAGVVNTAGVIGHTNQEDNTPAAFRAIKWYTDENGDSSNCTPSATVPASTTVCYGGWYLPSLYELEYIYYNFDAVQATLGSGALQTGVNYWSSTVDSSNKDHVYVVNFDAAGTAPTIVTKDINNENGWVRAIRAF